MFHVGDLFVVLLNVVVLREGSKVWIPDTGCVCVGGGCWRRGFVFCVSCALLARGCHSSGDYHQVYLVCLLDVVPCRGPTNNAVYPFLLVLLSSP